MIDIKNPELLPERPKKDFVSILNNTDMDIFEPFEREIFLFGTELSRSNCIEGFNEIIKNIETGEILNLFREPENEYDSLAVAVKTHEGEKIGYIPRYNNYIFARLMDAGKNLFARAYKKIYQGDVQNIMIKIYMKD